MLVMRADDICVRSTFRHSRWRLTIAFSMWIFSETKTCRHFQWYQKGSFCTQVEHDNASSTLVQMILADHLFGVFFGTQLVHNYFNSSLSLLYWAIQAGLLTPLTFAQHCLSPLAAFTSGACFFQNGRRWQWICEFYTANFKGIFGGTWS